MIVPWPPGGWVDILARLVGQKLQESLGQPVVIDNRAGATGNIGAEAAAKAAPDGYTAIMASNTLVLAPSLQSKLPFDVTRDFSPITLLTSTPYILLVHPSMPVRSVKELVALAKARPGQLNYSSSGTGSLTHLGMEMLKKNAGIEMVHIPHKGSAPSLYDLVAGHVSVTLINPTIALAQVKAGNARALAVTAEKRLTPAAPDIPTLAEAGVRGAEVGSWAGCLAPAGISQAIVKRLHNEIVRIMREPDVQARLQAEGAQSLGIGPEEFAAHIRSDLNKWALIVKQVGMRLD
jgi:tripartite-type tricarboxylate transporter receptor subunit TctC